MRLRPLAPIVMAFVRAFVVVFGVAAEAWLFMALLAPGIEDRIVAWCVAHALVSGSLAAVSCATLPGSDATARRRWFLLCACLNLAMPLAGALGTSLALTFGVRAAVRRDHGQDYWRFTDNPALPFTTPGKRAGRVVDGRGLAEQLAFPGDVQGLFRKVLAAARMPATLSIGALRAGVGHADERIRLTAYQTLDRKSSSLNDEIDRLSAQAVLRTGHERADTWLQVASNYWELLTLEQSEPVARAQLLEQAGEAALAAIVAWPDSRNAHFTFGRIALRQGDPVRAEAAFARAQTLGMPASTTLPYRAEAAFLARDFVAVQRLLASIDDAFKAYPPLRQVAEQWR